MTTYPHFPLQSQEVYHFTSNTLDSLPLPRPGAIASRDLWRVLVFAAAARLAVHQAWAQREGAPSGPTVLGTLASQGSERDVRDGHLNALWATLLPQGLGTRGRRVALEVVAWPYHGTVEEAQHAAVCRRTAQGSTPPLFPYATAYAVVRGRRDTLARGRVRAPQPMAQVLRPLRRAWSPGASVCSSCCSTGVFTACE
jgi:hypothetical protein